MMKINAITLAHGCFKQLLEYEHIRRRTFECTYNKVFLPDLILCGKKPTFSRCAILFLLLCPHFLSARPNFLTKGRNISNEATLLRKTSKKSTGGFHSTFKILFGKITKIAVAIGHFRLDFKILRKQGVTAGFEYSPVIFVVMRFRSSFKG